MGIKDDIVSLITNATTAIGKPMIEGLDFDIFYQPLHHKPIALPAKKIAVYTFYYKGQFLKIGQANSKSKARYQSQHYNYRSNQSTLARSLLADSTMNELFTKITVKQWIMDNCERYDVLIDATRHDKMTLNFIEGLLHYYYRPKYEN